MQKINSTLNLIFSKSSRSCVLTHSQVKWRWNRISVSSLTTSKTTRWRSKLALTQLLQLSQALNSLLSFRDKNNRTASAQASSMMEKSICSSTTWAMLSLWKLKKAIKYHVTSKRYTKPSLSLIQRMIQQTRRSSGESRRATLLRPTCALTAIWLLLPSLLVKSARTCRGLASWESALMMSLTAYEPEIRLHSKMKMVRAQTDWRLKIKSFSNQNQ